jgi:hypothetical protein
MQEYRTILTTKVQKQLQQKTGLRMQAKFKQLKKVNKHIKLENRNRKLMMMTVTIIMMMN